MNSWEYSTGSLYSEIAQKENIPILEELIIKGKKELEDIEKQKLDFGKKLSQNELEETLREIKHEVDKFLEAPFTEPCKICYNNFVNKTYLKWIWKLTNQSILPTKINISVLALTATLDATINISGTGNIPLSAYTTSLLIGPIVTALKIYNYQKNYALYAIPKEEISMPNVCRAKAIPGIAHEYTHHVQKKFTGILPSATAFLAFSEGMARGVQKHIARDHCEKENNKAFMHEITNCTNNELGRAYAHICQKLDIPVNEHLITDKKVTSLGYYDLGTTYFMLKEAKKGKGVYSESLHDFAKILTEGF